MFMFANVRPFQKSIFLEYPSVVRGERLIEVEKDRNTGEITIWAGKVHAVISPTYG